MPEFINTNSHLIYLDLPSRDEDLTKFAMLQFRTGPRGGKQVLKGSSLREMQRVHWLNSNWQRVAE